MTAHRTDVTLATGAPSGSYTITMTFTPTALAADVESTPAPDVTPQAVTVPSGTTGVSINLTAETITLPDGFTVAAYSINGGGKWKKGTLPTEAAKFSKLFDKELTLWLIDKEDGKGKPTDDATYIKFPTIKARPKANTEKLGPFYSDDNPANWMLGKKGSATYTAPTGVYEWAETSNSKTASGDWQSILGSGYPIKSPGTKVTYLFRTVAAADAGNYTPVSKTFKIKPAAFPKAPNYKAPVIKKGEASLKLKKGDFCKADGKTYGSLRRMVRHMDR